MCKIIRRKKVMVRKQLDTHTHTGIVSYRNIDANKYVAFRVSSLFILALIIIIKGHSLRRACLQPATNPQSSKPRPPTTNAKSKGKLENKIKHCSKLSTG